MSAGSTALAMSLSLVKMDRAQRVQHNIYTSHPSLLFIITVIIIISVSIIIITVIIIISVLIIEDCHLKCLSESTLKFVGFNFIIVCHKFCTR